MELLILLLAQILFVVFGPILAVAFGVLMFLLELVAMLIPGFGNFLADKNIFGLIHLRKILRFLAKLSVGLIGLVIVGTLVLQLFFFEPSVKWIVTKLAKKQGVIVYTGAITGNWFTGHFILSDVLVKGAKEEWDGTIENVTLKLNYLRILGKRSWAKELNANGGRFRYEGSESQANPDRRYREKRRFGVNHIKLEDIEINRTGNLPSQLRIDRFELENLKSEYAVFQILFRSNAKGVINDSPWSIVTSGNDEGRTTKWEFSDLPVSVAGDMFGGPFLWLKAGLVDIEVVDEWSNHDGAEIDMDWKFTLREFEAAAPPNSLIGDRVVDFVNQAEQPLDISFSLVLDKGKLKGSASLGAMGIGDAILKSLLPNDQAEEMKEKGKALLKDILERKSGGE